MSTLTVTARGRVTLTKEVLQRLGIEPGGKVELHLLPNGRAELRARTHEELLPGSAGHPEEQDKRRSIEHSANQRGDSRSRPCIAGQRQQA
ncbi:bifunctional DNA-binding transcriptional regulator/antitoxin component of YhaV-PrlF toxin-antitoxin module [Paraburkholderia sp. GAS448]|uniref:AbrB/MazE/SpoVT family DNA-binding domain-containing protein n=1 Tax=Paraburkholderia sp. GAS448 TaxID=3035136 RepID=UPI003D1FAD44